MKNYTFVFALVGSAVFSGLFTLFKTADEQAYRFGRVNSVNDTKIWIVNNLDFSVFTNSTCSLNYFRLSLDPGHCFTPYVDFPLDQQCVLKTNNPEAVYPYNRDSLLLQSAVGVFVFFGLFVAAYQPKSLEMQRRAARIAHVLGTLFYTFAVGIGFAIYESFTNKPTAEDLGRCKTLLDTTQAVCQLVSPLNPAKRSYFFPTCIENAKWNGTYPTNITLADLSSINMNITGDAVAEPQWMSALSFLNVELLTCSMVAVFALLIHAILKKTNLCFQDESRRPAKLALASSHDHDVSVNYDEESPLLHR